MALERLYLRPATWYSDNNITLRLNTRAIELHPSAQVITLEGDEHLSYDALAFTTGSHPNTLPASIGGDLDGVFSVRDLRDADAMAPAFEADKRVLIIGGGYIGLEAAAVAAKKGLKVTLVEMGARILQRVACPETSAYFRELHSEHGVEILEGVGLTRLIGEDHVTGAVLTNGRELALDFAVAGVGITPATVLAEAAGLEINNGIATNTFAQTSDPHIWAAGDCASLLRDGARIRIESVGNAIDQAEVAAQNMMGGSVEYLPRPWFWSDQYDVKLQIAGLNTGYTKVITRHGAGRMCSHWYYRGDVLLAVDAMNDPRGYMIGKRLIEAGKSPSSALIANPETDMKALLKS